jgi:hypothetical protein
MTLRESMEVRNSCRLHPARGEDPRKRFAVIRLLSRPDTHLESARAAQDDVPNYYAAASTLTGIAPERGVA